MDLLKNINPGSKASATLTEYEAAFILPVLQTEIEKAMAAHSEVMDKYGPDSEIVGMYRNHVDTLRPIIRNLTKTIEKSKEKKSHG